MFTNIIKKKELIDKEIELYKTSKILDADIEITQRILDGKKELAESFVRGNKEAQEYECTWHNKREKLNTEIALLEAKKDSQKLLLEETNKNYVSEYHSICKRYEDQIKNLKEIIESLVKKIPTEFTTTTINNK